MAKLLFEAETVTKINTCSLLSHWEWDAMCARYLEIVLRTGLS